MTTNQIDNSRAVTSRQFRGVVVGALEEKTVRVVVRTKKMHEKYKKQYWVSRKYAVHDEKNSAKIGDTVIFRECRPMSKSKRWRLVQVV
ncbi:MAG: 30S ribosomal protein S17 [Candidatus Magasanikbacteria bacterium CG10_big_fil_rev_8_21_14_0_10_47_10]|uniref:Small ribosomal subunit protein uS17 n=1 Tax=Candidatus Magasanikbacteria bacterium CG10_big_fil_rev_8_21_14_0_10_47_10 TaxID=1974652 RepID=A0A2H0TPA2_9BACT|nr:MAG: 30S ribosomal protein S17 [Candidatus Magasanikbacteria bacterium CG10_big_fil_rev_8_21_14_0_10_47_10]